MDERYPELYAAYPNLYEGYPKLYATHPNLYERYPELYAAYPNLYERYPKLYATYPNLYATHPNSYATYPRPDTRSPIHYRTLGITNGTNARMALLLIFASWTGGFFYRRCANVRECTRMYVESIRKVRKPVVSKAEPFAPFVIQKYPVVNS